MSALLFAMQVLNSLPSLIEAGVDVYDIINSTNENLKKMMDEDRDPTDEEWETLNELIESLRAQRSDVSEGE